MESSTSIRGGELTTVVYRPEEINDNDFFSHLPEELICRIFSYLSAHELARCCALNRRCARLASDPRIWLALLKRIFSDSTVFGGANWNELFDLSSMNISIQDEPPLRTSISTRSTCLASLPPIEGNKGVTLLTIPKGLSLKKLVELAQAKQKNLINRINPIILTSIGTIEVDKTYRIWITNNILENSRNLSPNTEEEFLKKHGCRRPKLLEKIALLVTTFLSTQNRLYSDVMARCIENGSHQDTWFIEQGIWTFPPLKEAHSNRGITGVM